MRIATAVAACLCGFCAWSQAMYQNSATVPDSLFAVEDTLPRYESLLDSLLAEGYAPDTVMSFARLPRQFFLPQVYRTYQFVDSVKPFSPEITGTPGLEWAENLTATQRRMQAIQHRMLMTSPEVVKYNYAWLPEAPKEFVAVVNPEDHTISINEITADINSTTLEAEKIEKKHWIKTFNASLQFSQAYVSPNWYQGGNDNLNALIDLYYNVKLNQTFHPKLLFETTFQYKLGMNNAPDDSLRNYNVSTDILQINSVFGYKAAHNWYYSVTGQFKTQLINAYPTNSNQLKSAFLSPGELNLGLGMTYSHANPAKTVQFDASIAPFSYNLAMCTNNRLNPTAYGIDEGKHFKSNIGSSAECKLGWKICDTINFSSRLFCFTDYDRAYADWENTLVFQLTRFMTCQLYAHLRYDTDTPPSEDPGKWKKLQVKEILSIGFSYKFSTI